MTGRGAGTVLVVGLLGACAGPREQIVEDRFDIAESSRTPVVDDIADLGGGDVPLQGILHVEASDGVAVIGETLWIHGTAFGRQPAVTVGGRPAAVLARTRDGGIVVRVPPLTPTGAQPVVVSNEVGRGEKTITVRRLAAVLSGDGGQLAWAALEPNGPVAAGVTPTPGRRLLALSPDGRAAYVAEAGRSVVDVIDVAANGAPKVVYQLDLGKEPIVGLAAAARAWTVAVVRAADVVLLDVTSALRPARSTPRTFPAEVRDARIVSADLSPDGKLLALASGEGNRVTLLDLVPREHAVVATTLAVLPDVRESVIADVAFSPSGDTLWIATGDTPRSRAAEPAADAGARGPPRGRRRRAGDAHGGAHAHAPRRRVARAAVDGPDAPARERLRDSLAARARDGLSHGEDARAPAACRRRSGGRAVGRRRVPRGRRGRGDLDAHRERPLRPAGPVPRRAVAPHQPHRRRRLGAPLRGARRRPPGRAALDPAARPVRQARRTATAPAALGSRAAVKRLRATVRGRVQGVGFRASAASEARRLRLTGWVRNRLDGDVEVEAEGADDAAEAFLAWLRRGPSLAHVTGVDPQWLPAAGDGVSFEVR